MVHGVFQVDLRPCWVAAGFTPQAPLACASVRYAHCVVHVSLYIPDGACS
jgi:hypothetical protein